MDEESKQHMDDCFLRPLVDARSTNTPAYVPPPAPTAPLKTELQVLRLSEDAQNSVMETLRFVHGENFQLADKTKYKDKGTARSTKGYWEDRGNLVVQGITNYSNVQKSGCDITDRFRILSISKLESYGFHKAHCIEALDYCKSDMDESLKLLFSKYFPSVINSGADTVNYSDTEILEMRTDEILALQSIFDKSFDVKETNKVWQLQLKLDYLLKFSPSERKKLELSIELEKQLKNMTVKKKNDRNKTLEKCRNFDKGKCKYGTKCRYSHQLDEYQLQQQLQQQNPSSALSAIDNNWFYLEIRFPMNCQYPYEAPMIFFKSTCPDLSSNLCLRITRRLVEETRELAKDGMPSVYTIIDLLQMEQTILDFLNGDRHKFLDGKYSIFYEPSVDEHNLLIEDNLPTHNKMGTTGRSNRNAISSEQILNEDINLVNKFINKNVSQRYKELLQVRRDLPAWSQMSDILNLIESNPVVVISGETGCGKSTQIPQFILDNWLLKSSMLTDKRKTEHIEIVCTQPRRISAIGVAERVAEERNERIGNTVGYQIRLENKISISTRLTFCTTGILLRRLQSDPLLGSISHVIVDEVHERSEESDFLLLILKELMVKRKDFKLILMSATLNANLFSKYFNGAPTLEIPGRTHPVEQIFLEEILERSHFVLEADSQYCRNLDKSQQNEILNELEFAGVKASNAMPPNGMKDENLQLCDLYARYNEYNRATCKTLYLMDPLKINPELIESILKFIIEGDHDWPDEGAILIFLPGLAEIQTVYDALCDSAMFNPRSGKYLIIPLHSTLTSEEQMLVFKKPPMGKRKIVLSTNIAETSVTIDDCVFVIDCGQMKEKHFDANRNMESLDLVWISRANALQRKGRAGRVRPGICIHLFTHYRYSYHIISQPVAEIHRVSLEQLLLRIKTLSTFNNRDVYQIIGSTMEPPSEESINSAIQRLREVGAFDENQSLTPLGHHLSALPVDVRIGKLMLYGAMFQCIDSILTIAACLSHKSPFVSPFSKRNEADIKKREFSILNSDHLTVLKAYKRWIEANKRSKYAGRCFANENYLSTRTLDTIIEIKQQLLELLVSIGFVPIDYGGRKTRLRDNILEVTGFDMNQHNDNNRLLSALLCAALYPNVVKVLTPEKSFTQSSGGAVPRQPLANELRFKTHQDGYVSIHPSSVNSKVGYFSSPFLVFQEKVKTSKIYIRECTMVPLLPLILFSGSNIKIELYSGDFIILLEDGWIMIKASAYEIAEMMKCLRNELTKLLEEKIRDPCLNLLHNNNGKKVISTIIYLISKE